MGSNSFDFSRNGLTHRLAKRMLVGLTASALGMGIAVSVQQPAAAAGEWGCVNRLYKQGSRGECVRTIQRVLNVYAMTSDLVTSGKNQPPYLSVGAADGAFGPKTRRAMIRFQQNERLKADAIVGARTWKELCIPVSFAGQDLGNGKYKVIVHPSYPYRESLKAGCKKYHSPGVTYVYNG